jgi:signal transduction histidine kinase
MTGARSTGAGQGQGQAKDAIAGMGAGIAPLDGLLALAIAGAIETLAWNGGVIGDPIRGPRALVVALPLLMALPLLWRRRWPLLVWTLAAAGIVAQAVASHHSAEGLEILAVLFVGSYSVAAYADRRRALVGLAVFLVTYAVYAWEDPNTRSGRTSDEWATAFFGALTVASWLAGLVTYDRRTAAAAAARAVALERDREQVLTEERSRIARELHDIVSHNLSVVVLQASGARARSDADSDDVSATLEKIETSGRTALVEMRRMLGVLRAGTDGPELAPQPGLGDIADLVESVRRSGLDVALETNGDLAGVPSAVELSAYRIVQESLTNTMRHAEATRADVAVRRDDGALVVEVHDESALPPRPVTAGHGLTGMRERAALLGGDFLAGWDARGFVVRVRLPIAAVPTARADV